MPRSPLRPLIRLLGHLVQSLPLDAKQETIDELRGWNSRVAAQAEAQAERVFAREEVFKAQVVQIKNDLRALGLLRDRQELAQGYVERCLVRFAGFLLLKCHPLTVLQQPGPSEFIDQVLKAQPGDTRAIQQW